MKTLADFKRALTIGSKWEATHASGINLGVGIVEIINTTGVAFKREGKENPSWLNFPKASEFKINDLGECEIYWPATYTYQGVERVEIPKKLVLTYRKL